MKGFFAHCALVPAFLALPIFAADSPYGFKAYILGSSRTIAVADKRFVHCENITPTNVLGCLAVKNLGTIADAEIQVMQLDYYDDKLYRIELTVSSNSFTSIFDALNERYQNAKSDSEETVSNRAGHSMRSRVVVWSNKMSSITLVHRALSWDTTAVIFSLQGATAKQRDIYKAQAKNAAKDL